MIPNFFRRPSGGFRPPIISYFLPFVKQQQQLFKKFFVKTFFRFLKNIFIVPHFWGFVKKKMQQQQKIFSFIFFDPAGFFGVCQVFFSEAGKIFLSSIFSKKKKKKKIVPLILYHILADLSSIFLKKIFYFLLDFAFKVCYNYIVRLGKGVLPLVKTFTKKFQKVLDLT